MYALAWFLTSLTSVLPASAQTHQTTRRYAIDMAGARIGTMTLARQTLPGN